MSDLLAALAARLDAAGPGLAQPWALLALLVLPLLWWTRRRRRPAAVPAAILPALRDAQPRGGTVSAWLRRLRTLAIVGIVVALAWPFARARARAELRQGIDIMLAVDISSSMLAEDFQPANRLEVARAQLKEFVRRRADDRLGIVAFAGEALTQVPLTGDHALVLQAVENLQPGQLDDGTAIGTAIATAANRLRAAGGPSRVLVLLTDGVNNRGQVDPRTAARAAAAFGVRIYAIGVGTEGMAPVPVGRGLFGLRYETRPVEIDDKLLTEVARGTGGRYFRARDAQALARVTDEIDRLERTTYRTRRTPPRSDWYLLPASLALLALGAEVALLWWRGTVP